MCEPDWKGAMLGSAGFFGQLLTLPILPLLADKFGRKNFFVGGRIIETILFSVLMYTTNWFVMVAVMLGFGMLATSRLTIGITYLVELFPKKHQTCMLSIFFTESSLTYIMCTLYFWKLGKDWFNFVAVGYVTCVVTLILSFFVPESPRALFTLGKIEEGKKALDFIAKVNRQPAFDWDKIDFSVVHRCLEKSQGRFEFCPINAYSAVYQIKIRDLPPETDLPKISKMLTRRMSTIIDETRVLEQGSRNEFSRRFTISFDSRGQA